MSFHLQQWQIKKNLQIIFQQSNEIISVYYHWICSFWQKVKILKEDQIDQFLMIMLFRFSSSLLVKNYISVQNLLNDTRTIEDWHRNVSHYHSHFNRNKQIMISIIISKSLTSTETTCMNCISSASITSTFTFSALFTYSNQKFDSIASKSENWTDAWYNSQTNSKKLTIEEKFQF